MSDQREPPALPSASPRRARRVSIIWLIPIVAVAIGVWLAWDTLSKQGPTITISFESGEGLQAGQSQLKFKDIVFGTVQSLALSPDQSHVLVTVAMTREAEPLLTQDTIFWVVKPRLFAGNVTGLGTLFSGVYVGMLPGKTGGKREREFVGHEDPPVLEVNTPGRVFLLRASRLGSISLGSPVFFHDLDVGQVLKWDLTDMAETVTIHAFIRAPFDTYIHDETRFWNASGISVKLAGAGLQVQMESLRALLLGGIAFSTPAEYSHTEASAEKHVFPLFADQDTANAASYTRKIPVISYFSGSVRGLGPGSEVTMQGFKIGAVTDVRLIYDPVKDKVLAPVRYELEPERVLGVGRRVFKTPAEGAADLVKRGLRATLESTSLITGQQAVVLKFVPDAPPATVSEEGGYFVLPSTEGGGFAGLEASATELLNKVNTIPFEQMGKNIDGILQSVNDAVKGPQLRQAVTDLAATLASAKDFVQHLDAGTAPALRELPKIADELEKALTNANLLIASLNSGYGDNTQFNRDLDRLLVQTSDAVRSIRALADLLARHPEALVKGRPEGGVE
jgi:paraquat-inducible protein B